MVSMKDIAAKCGVSVATVSKALNDQTDIGIETRNLIKQTAKELGYFPNSQARALRTNKSFNIGVLFVDQGQSGLTHDYFARVLDSFKAYVEEHGYDLTFINCARNRAGRMPYIDHCRYRGFDGIIIACIDFHDPEVTEIFNSSIPLVAIDYVFNSRSSVISNNYGSMTSLTDYVVKCGHRKIAYVCGDDTAVTRNRLAAFYNILEKNGIEIPDDYVLHGSYRDIEITEKLTDALLDRSDRPTCIMYSDDYSAQGGLNSIYKHGLVVPDDISIAGFDGINVVAKREPILTTIKQDTKRIGEVAAEKLLNLIEHPKTTLEEQIIIDGKLVEGRSVKKLTKSEA